LNNESTKCFHAELLIASVISLQEKWSVSQEKSKLSALQMSVEQERTLLTDQLTRERAELGRAKVLWFV